MSADRRNETMRTDGGVVADVWHATVQSPRLQLQRVLHIAGMEYRLAVRGRWALGLTTVFALFGVGLATFSGADVAPAGYERTVASLAALAVYLVPLAALAFGFDTIVGREESGWLHALFALPLARSRVVLGLFLGRVVVFAGATIIGFGIAGGLLLREFGFAGWPTFVWFVLAAVGAGVAFLSIAVLVSTVTSEKTHALGVVLAAWAWFVLIYDLLALGIIAAFRLPESAITALVLGNPAGIFRVLVLDMLETGGSGGYAAAFATTGIAPSVLVLGLTAWIVIPLAIAVRLVRRRSL